VRQLAHDYKGIGPKESRLDLVLGPAWRQLYQIEPALGDLFDTQHVTTTTTTRRLPSQPQIEEWFKQRLESIFAYVSDPLPIFRTPGRQMFSLFLGVSNPRSAAIKLAKQFERHVFKKYAPKASRQRSRP
jgi:hypothetical protein